VDYRNYDAVTKNLGAIDYLHQRDLGENRDKFPYAQYLLDYFKYAFNEYLKVSEFSVKGIDNVRDGADGVISIQETFRYENKKDYNLKKDFEDLKKIDDAYNIIKNGYYKLCIDIIIPMFESSRPMTANDVYWKKDDYDAQVEELMKDMANVGYTYKDIVIPVYDRETNEEITTVSFGNFSSYGKPTEKELEPEPEQLNAKIADSINSNFQNRYRKYPKYNKELIQNFLKEVFPKQLTFKDYLAQK
jgi:hypothetical protein